MTLTLLLVAGGLGGLARYELAGVVQRLVGTPRPWGTAAVNLLGAAALGLLVGLQASDAVGADTVRVLGTGFLGGFTTFSTWMVESVHLAEDAASAGLRAGLVNLAGMLALGIAGAAAGAWVAS